MKLKGQAGTHLHAEVVPAHAALAPETAAPPQQYAFSTSDSPAAHVTTVTGAGKDGSGIVSNALASKNVASAARCERVTQVSTVALDETTSHATIPFKNVVETATLT